MTPPLVLEVVPGGNQTDDACGIKQKTSRTGQLHSKRLVLLQLPACGKQFSILFGNTTEHPESIKSINQLCYLKPMKLQLNHRQKQWHQMLRSWPSDISIPLLMRNQTKLSLPLGACIVQRAGHNVAGALAMIFSFFIGVSWNRGTPKWIVYKGKPH